MKRIVIYMVLALALASCFKETGYNTKLILKTLQENESAGELSPLQGVKLYAFAADTTAWGVGSYEQAEAGVITNRESGKEKGPLAVTEPLIENNTDGNLSQMNLTQESVMLVAVDTQNRCYAYSNYKVGENLETTYLTIIFRTWKTSSIYKEGKWLFVPTIVEEPEETEPKVQQ